MIKGWKECKLGDVAEIKTGKSNAQDSILGGIYPLFDRSQSIKQSNRFLFDDEAIIIAGEGKVFTPRYFNGKFDLHQRVYAIHKITKAIPKFIFYAIWSNKKYFESVAVGSTVMSLRLNHFTDFPLLLPTLQEQKAIAEILSSLDDKIDLLHRQNQTLESIAQTLFRQWFVDFNYPDATGEMIDSEMGEIPKSWRIGKIGDIVNIYDSQRIPLSSQQRELRKGIYPYYGATKIVDYIDDFIFDGTYLLFAEDGSVSDINDKPILQYVWGKFWVSNHTHILQGKNGFSTELLYIAFKNLNVSRIITGAVQPKINQANLLNYEILIPDKAVLNSFIQIINPFFNKFKSNQKQIQTLENLRDTLLPKLISGEVRIK